MASKRNRQRISYVLENTKASAGGHRLGVLASPSIETPVFCKLTGRQFHQAARKPARINPFATPIDNLANQPCPRYSGGRDGAVCAWDLDLDLRNGRKADVHDSEEKPKNNATTFRAQTQAHPKWINDILLTQHNTALVTASADTTVKVWRPHAYEKTEPQELGRHADYVRRLAAPPDDMGLNWVASGGLDRKVCLWDLNGGGKTLEIDTAGEDKPEKGSVYALATGRNILAVGSPEKTLRLYDWRSGTRISRMPGHTDNIRSIIIDDAGERILTASADKTIKMWDVKDGRCLHTFTMHDEQVWSLYSDDPRLGIFYSTDRSGLIAKTDIRGSLDDVDNGLSIAVAKEHSFTWKAVPAGGYIWTASDQSSINRWDDIDMDDHAYLRDKFRRARGTSVSSKAPRTMSMTGTEEATEDKKKISSNSILRISNTAPFPLRVGDPDMAQETTTEKKSEVTIETQDLEVKPVHQLPAETIEGQFGLLKHKLLNDRRRVLTLDTAGEVVMWDLIKCKPIKSFGKQHLEDVEQLVNTREAVAPWCSIDLSSGNLTVVLEQYNCFDAEVYADELDLDEPVEFREDQRISLGRWILRYLFANLIDEEIKRDEDYRQKLNEGVEKRQAATRANAPTSIPLPQNTLQSWETSEQTTTPKANGLQIPSTTPGLGINQATPGPNAVAGSPMSPVEKRMSHQSRRSGDNDYFSSSIGPVDSGAKPAGTPATPAAESTEAAKDDKDKEKDKAADNGKSPVAFGKKFQKPAVVEEKAEESESSSNHEKEVEDNFYGVIQKMRNEYDRQLAESPDKIIGTRMDPSLPSETPVLKLPSNTKVFIQEETSGSTANLYEGTVGSVGRDADVIEQKGPMWLGHVLLQNEVTWKEPVKISFVLHPTGDLPTVASADGNNRLNANRMLRVRKILSYVAERIEQQPEEPEENPLKPEEYLDLYCNEQRLDPLMSLATLRTHVWKGGNDIVLHYKANGRKEIRLAPPPPEPVPEPEATQETTEGANNANAAPTMPGQIG